jgi:DNA-binding PadR family transcriptional regulator
MATGFALLSMDKNIGTPLHHWDQKWEWRLPVLTRTLKSMEEKGLIIRKKNPDDGRGVLIYLTELGKEKETYQKTLF